MLYYNTKNRFLNKKKVGSYLLSRDEPSIIDVRELDFRVRNGNGYYLSTMATDILYNVKNEVRKLHEAGTQDGYFRSVRMNGNDDMAKSHDLLVMLG